MTKYNFLKTLVIKRQEVIFKKSYEIASLKKLAMTSKMTLRF